MLKEDDVQGNKWRLGVSDYVTDNDGLVRKVKVHLGDRKLSKNGDPHASVDPTSKGWTQNQIFGVIQLHNYVDLEADISGVACPMGVVNPCTGCDWRTVMVQVRWTAYMLQGVAALHR